MNYPTLLVSDLFSELDESIQDIRQSEWVPPIQDTNQVTRGRARDGIRSGARFGRRMEPPPSQAISGRGLIEEKMPIIEQVYTIPIVDLKKPKSLELGLNNGKGSPFGADLPIVDFYHVVPYGPKKSCDKQWSEIPKPVQTRLDIYEKKPICHDVLYMGRQYWQACSPKNKCWKNPKTLVTDKMHMYRNRTEPKHLPCGTVVVACNVTKGPGNWSLYVNDPDHLVPLKCGEDKTWYHKIFIPCEGLGQPIEESAE